MRVLAQSGDASRREATGYEHVAAFWNNLGVGNPPNAYPWIALGVFETIGNIGGVPWVNGRPVISDPRPSRQTLGPSRQCFGARSSKSPSFKRRTDWRLGRRCG